ncbi:hypothetical protein [Streptomyces spongiae]|uniref:Integral membrane protein n=1 Tax=Streptomyces spongiae TaxID=565072 RepID=A0A5N8XYM6_9ACTN|nr:hypothetical protein [Streptomyces spongiae]MPY64464.1 hypothetical protein [Streptomyces spongiae]
MPRHVRSALSAVLIALASLLAPLGALAAWATYEIGDGARYEAATAALAADPHVRNEIADAVTAGVMREVRVAPPLKGPVRAFTRDAVRSFTQTEAYRIAWSTANRAAHDTVLRAVRDDATAPVTLDVAPVTERVKERLVHDRVPFAHRIPVEHTEVVVLSSENLDRLRKGYRVLELTSFWLPSLTVALAAGGLLVSACRRRAVFATGLGTALGGALLGIAVAVGRHVTLTDLPPDVSRAAAAAVYDALTATLRTVTWLLVVLGLAVALAAWVTGFHDHQRRPSPDPQPTARPTARPNPR